MRLKFWRVANGFKTNQKPNEEYVMFFCFPRRAHSSNVFMIVLSREIEIEKNQQQRTQQLLKQRPNRMIALKTNTTTTTAATKKPENYTHT